MSDITYCSRIDCCHISCDRHQDKAPKDSDISIADLNDGLCYDSIFPQPNNSKEALAEYSRKRLLEAICIGTQHTNYKCDEICRRMCGSDGFCIYCETIADAIEKEFRK